jgi:magnesium transporter
MREIREGEREELLEELEPHEMAKIVAEMHSDDAADVLQEMDEEDQAKILQFVPAEERSELVGMLAYPEESAGGIMQTELVRVRERWTVHQARDEIRRTRDEVGELHEIFVVDRNDHLKGWVKERALILASDEDLIGTITTPVPKRVSVNMDQEDIARLVGDYDLSSVPVVDEEDHLVGRILVDDIVDVLTEEATEDITRMAGTTPEEIYEPSVRQALRSRTPWLLVALVGEVCASLVIASGSHTVKSAGMLFAFIPPIVAMAGSVSSQAATVTVRSLALGHIRRDRVFEVLRKEVSTGFIIALGVNLVLGGVALVVGRDLVVALIASISVLGTMTIGITFGVVTPLVLQRLGADPAVATSPFVATMNDLLGASVILMVATMLL